jgi:hypothetical protein
MLRFDVLELLRYIFIVGKISSYLIMKSDKFSIVGSTLRV